MSFLKDMSNLSKIAAKMVNVGKPGTANKPFKPPKQVTPAVKPAVKRSVKRKIVAAEEEPIDPFEFLPVDWLDDHPPTSSFGTESNSDTSAQKSAEDLVEDVQPRPKKSKPDTAAPEPNGHDQKKKPVGTAVNEVDRMIKRTKKLVALLPKVYARETKSHQEMLSDGLSEIYVWIEEKEPDEYKDVNSDDSFTWNIPIKNGLLSRWQYTAAYANQEFEGLMSVKVNAAKSIVSVRVFRSSGDV